MAVSVIAVGLTGCVGDVAVQVPETHPASPRAAAGVVETPTALSAYKSADAFETPPPQMPGMSGMGHGAMPGMDHGDMPGMQHGGTPPGASSR
jgi:uncharacterized protein involved in copper resistance